jgi:hypothetical protein
LVLASCTRHTVNLGPRDTRNFVRLYPVLVRSNVMKNKTVWAKCDG